MGKNFGIFGLDKQKSGQPENSIGRITDAMLPWKLFETKKLKYVFVCMCLCVYVCVCVCVCVKIIPQIFIS
uniref:Bm9895 n=1 Tax=Brugia malayi TaxID=6279 RepID=A0A1I9G6L7_BRUMA|nr:Bm9895 [Brugia malayi]